jgi:hypothetical protein
MNTMKEQTTIRDMKKRSLTGRFYPKIRRTRTGSRDRIRRLLSSFTSFDLVKPDHPPNKTDDQN